MAQSFYLKIGMKIVLTHLGLLRELNEVRCIKNLTQCFAYSKCTVNESQSLSTGSDFVPPRGHVAVSGDAVGCYNWEGVLLASNG